MNVELLKQLGNIGQIAGIRESRLLRGRGEGIAIAEFYNAAGLRFTVVPDRCMDLFDLSYKGVNLGFQSKNGLTSPQAFCPSDGEFSEQWPGGMLVTCGLGNVGGHATNGGQFPTHGRISHVPAQNFGTETYRDGARDLLLNSRVIRLHDVLTNFEAEDEPYMLLYHFNFGYPLLQADTLVEASKAERTPMNELSTDYHHMMAPVDGRDEELYFRTNLGSRACGVVYNERLELGAYVAFDTANLPNMVQWKMMKSHDYVLALEPCNTFGINRDEAAKEGKLAVLPAYASVENHLELGVLDGLTEIRSFLRQL